MPLTAFRGRLGGPPRARERLSGMPGLSVRLPTCWKMAAIPSRLHHEFRTNQTRESEALPRSAARATGDKPKARVQQRLTYDRRSDLLRRHMTDALALLGITLAQYTALCARGARRIVERATGRACGSRRNRRTK